MAGALIATSQSRDVRKGNHCIILLRRLASRRESNLRTDRERATRVYPSAPPTRLSIMAWTLTPSEKLKTVRARLGITTREVSDLSQRIAEDEDNPEFHISNAWRTQVENSDSVPSIFKLYSLSAIYRIKFTDLLLLYGVDLQHLGKS